MIYYVYTMLCYVILHYIISYYIILQHVITYVFYYVNCAVLNYFTFHYSMQHSIIFASF